ncbi:hypothetical protein [Hydrocoleum sp. CS-953]|nr:hypothetical protein [Hydrocoleum sp. CS-953]
MDFQDEYDIIVVENGAEKFEIFLSNLAKVFLGKNSKINTNKKI